MGFDPVQEDYEHMILRFYQSVAPSSAAEAERKLATFDARYAKDRDSLPQTDADRAFHLVSEAAVLIDYRLPFAAERSVDGIIAKAQKLLQEALTLDPENIDALRMLEASRQGSYEGLWRYLAERHDDAKARTERLLEAAEKAASDEERSLIAYLAEAPYLRWLAAEADRALICGHYRIALDRTQEALGIDPSDQAGVTDTAAYAFAKLEDAEGIGELCSWMHDQGIPESAWTKLARLSLAFRLHRIDEARGILQELLRRYPEADSILTLQHELPDGIYARLPVEPGSEDELILAVSEAAVLLQEGRDSKERGTLASWIACEVPKIQAAEGRHLRLSPQQEGDGR